MGSHHFSLAAETKLLTEHSITRPQKDGAIARAMVDTHIHTQTLNKKLHPAKCWWPPSLARSILFPSLAQGTGFSLRSHMTFSVSPTWPESSRATHELLMN